MDAEKPGLLAAQFAALGTELGVPPKLDAEATVQAVGGELRRRGRWLLILDNAEDVNHIRPVLPGGGEPPTGRPPDRQPALFETSLPGVFAIGDVRHGSIKRVASAVGEGSVAVRLLHDHLGT